MAIGGGLLGLEAAHELSLRDMKVTVLPLMPTLMERQNVARVGRFRAAPNMAAKPGLKAVDMFRSIAEGRIKALWVMATNPAVSMPDAGAVREALAGCPFVVRTASPRPTLPPTPM